MANKKMIDTHFFKMENLRTKKNYFRKFIKKDRLVIFVKFDESENVHVEHFV